MCLFGTAFITFMLITYNQWLFCSYLNTKLSITSSFFELKSPDFAWKFVWTVRTKYKSTKVQKSTKVLITQPFFELHTPDCAWKFIWTVQSNGKVQKYKKYKYKSTKEKNTPRGDTLSLGGEPTLEKMGGTTHFVQEWGGGMKFWPGMGVAGKYHLCLYFSCFTLFYFFCTHSWRQKVQSLVKIRGPPWETANCSL